MRIRDRFALCKVCRIKLISICVALCAAFIAWISKSQCPRYCLVISSLWIMGSSSPGVSTISTEFSKNFSGVKSIVCLMRLQRRLGWFAEVYLGSSSILISMLCAESWICFVKTSRNSAFLNSVSSSDSAIMDFTSSHSCLFQKHTCA